jgi:hypothetical protein
VAVVRGCWHYARSVASASPLGSLRFGVALPSSVPLPLVLKVVAIVVVVPTVLVLSRLVRWWWWWWNVVVGKRSPATANYVLRPGHRQPR